MNNSHGLDKLKGFRVTKVVAGIGSFINIYFSNTNCTEELRLWIYLCDWAIVKEGVELLCSQSGEISQFNFSDIFGRDAFYIDTIFLDKEEFHIVFSHDITIEMWGDEKSYGPGSEMLALFQNDKLIKVIKLGEW